MDYIKNHKVALLFIGIVLLSLVRIVADFYTGYSSVPYNVLSLLFTEPVRYSLIIFCLFIVVTAELSRNRKTLALVGLTLLLILGLVPPGHYLTLGALLSIQNAKPEQFRSEARILLDEYKSNTRFSDLPPSTLNEYEQFPRSKIPLPILRANIGDVFVLEKYILIEKFGLGGSFRGFIVFREGSDIWKDDNPVMLLEGCNYCWKIRIIDGLYWYHAAPVEEEDEKIDFLSK